MQITNAQWTDATRTMVRAEINGAVSFIPADPTGNAHFAHLLALGEGAIAEPAEEEAAAQPIGEGPAEAPVRRARRPAAGEA